MKIATQELVQDILAPMFQSAHQLASQNLVVIKPTSPQEVSANLPGEVTVNALAERSQWEDPAKHSGDGLMVCFIYSSQGTSQTGCSHLASGSHPGLVTTVTMTLGT